MFKAIKENKIIAINETGNFPCLVYDNIIKDTEHQISDFVMVGDEFVLDTDTKAIEKQKENVRQVRNSMLEYIEWRVARAREQRELGIKTVDNYYNLIHYKQYLRDYPDKTENWWEQNPLEFEDWEKQYEYRQES